MMLAWFNVCNMLLSAVSTMSSRYDNVVRSIRGFQAVLPIRTRYLTDRDCPSTIDRGISSDSQTQPLMPRILRRVESTLTFNKSQRLWAVDACLAPPPCLGARIIPITEARESWGSLEHFERRWQGLVKVPPTASTARLLGNDCKEVLRQLSRRIYIPP
ncbi:hypothetical protein F4818DRAFT_28410 [Hypoxylon cercidicola]|nr:hypothetical protein F4818DRAFT_28410 [Hypoxylon cercidicola]